MSSDAHDPTLMDDDDDLAPVVPVSLSARLGEEEAALVAVEDEDDEVAVAVADADEVAELEADGEEFDLPGIHQPVLPEGSIEIPVVETQSSHNKEKAAAVLVAVLVHVALALLLTVFIVAVPGPPSSEITAISAPTTTEQVPTTQKIAEPPPPQSVSQPMASMKFMTATNASAVPMPAVEFDPVETSLDLGSTMGTFDANFASTGAGSVVMFGKELKNVRQIAVVMDVSRSMTRYLPEVVKELKKVGRDSPLVLYFGCWLTPVKDLEKVIPVGDEQFDKFWQYWQGKNDMRELMNEYPKLKYDPKKPMNLEDVYKQVANRKQTYFIDRLPGPTSVKSALLAREIKDADTIYWFADFMDRVDDETAAEVVKKLRARNRKLFIHAPHDKGPSLNKVIDKMVKPLGGEPIILDIK